MADIKYNYKLNIKGLMTVEDGKIILSVEDAGDFDLAYLCEDFSGKIVKIGVTYDEDYTEPDVDKETGEILE